MHDIAQWKSLSRLLRIFLSIMLPNMYYSFSSWSEMISRKQSHAFCTSGEYSELAAEWKDWTTWVCSLAGQQHAEAMTRQQGFKSVALLGTAEVYFRHQPASKKEGLLFALLVKRIDMSWQTVHST